MPASIGGTHIARPCPLGRFSRAQTPSGSIPRELDHKHTVKSHSVFAAPKRLRASISAAVARGNHFSSVSLSEVSSSRASHGTIPTSSPAAICLGLAPDAEAVDACARTPNASTPSRPTGAEGSGEVPGHLRSPGTGRTAGHPEQVDPAGAVFDDERHVQARQRHRTVDVQEIDRQDRLGLGTQERAPSVVADSWWRDTVSPEDFADGAGTGTMAQTTQLTLDPDHAPVAVLRPCRCTARRHRG